MLTEFFHCLWRDYKYANFLILNGFGQNGKSVLQNLIKRFLGKHNISAESLERLLNKQFAPASLYNKLVNIDADVSGDGLIKNTGVLKKLTGNDESPAEFKYKTPFKFQNYAKLFFSCNKIPQTDDETDAFFRRPIIVNFTQQFLAEKDDPHILEKLTTEEEFSGLLHELLGRLPRIIRQGIRPTTNKTMREIYNKYIQSLNPIRFFAEKALDVVVGNMIPVQGMYDLYSQFCRAHRMAIMSGGAFSRELGKLGFQKDQRMHNKVRAYYWLNVKVKDWKAIEDSGQEGLSGFFDEQ